MNKKEIFYYECWYKNTFTFMSKDRKELQFVPYYRSDIGKEITIEQCIKEGCEYITLDGKKIGE